jgi:hypothetical protein
MPVLDSVTLWGGDKQPEDRYTRELPGLDAAAPTVKRGRGRPRLDNALTPAERAKRYRDSKKHPPGFQRKYFCASCGWVCSAKCERDHLAKEWAAYRALHG